VARPFGTAGRIFNLAVTAAWLVPVVTLLVLNIQQSVVGASFKCRLSECRFFWFENGGKKVQQLSLFDRNIAGVMQIVAKVIELWFLFIACSLVYNITMRLGRRRDGSSLPIQFLFLHDRLVDPSMFLRPSFWTMPRHAGANQHSRRRTVGLYVFLVFVLALCVVSNLMGPAAAVLLLPTKGRATVGTLVQRQFLRLQSGKTPTLEIHNNTYGDGIEFSIPASPRYAFSRSDLAAQLARSDSRHLTLSNHDRFISISVLLTGPIVDDDDDDEYTWIPNAQILQRLRLDVARFWAVSEGDPESVSTYGADNETLSQTLMSAYRTSVDLVLERRGPALRLLWDCSGPNLNISVISAGEGKLVRCYTLPLGMSEAGLALEDSGIVSPDSGLLTMCVRVGPGWSGQEARNDYAQFFVERPYAPLAAQGPNKASINIYSVTGAIYLNESMSHCAIGGGSQPRNRSPCSWDAMFSEPLKPGLSRISLEQQIIDYDYPFTASTNGSTYSPGNYISTPWCHSFTALGFGTYNTPLDTNDGTAGNNTRFLSTTTAEDSDPVYIHPSWFLAAWAIENGGTVRGNLSDTAARSLIDALAQDWALKEESPVLTTLYLRSQHAAIMGSTLTIINYDEQVGDGIAPASVTSTTPILDASVNAMVLQYGLYTRSSILGFVIATIGCVVVLANAFLTLGWYCERPGALNLFMEGLARPPPDTSPEVYGKTESEYVKGLQFRVKED